MSVFGRYAGYYDAIYSDKDYEAECDFLETVFSNLATTPVRRVLDAGCGTGRHALILARRGIGVVGTDMSAEMLAVAARNGRELPSPPSWIRQDMRQLRLDETFDAVICMFAAICYLTSAEEIEQALAAFRRHLNPGGLLVVEYMSGDAVVSEGPSRKVKQVDADGLALKRTANPAGLDYENKLLSTRYVIEARDETGIVDHLTETHTVRYLFHDEIAEHAARAGFVHLATCRLSALDQAPLPSDWPAVMVGTAM